MLRWDPLTPEEEWYGCDFSPSHPYVRVDTDWCDNWGTVARTIHLRDDIKEWLDEYVGSELWDTDHVGCDLTLWIHHHYNVIAFMMRWG